MINPLTNRQHIHSEIDKSIKKHLEELKRRSDLVKKRSFQYASGRRGHELTIEKLMTALICYLSFKTDSLWKEDAKKMSKERAVNKLIEDILQKNRSSQNGASIKERISKFHNLSLHSPHVFFHARKA